MSIELDELIAKVEEATEPNRWTDCPKVMTLEQMIIGLAVGRTLCVDRSDSPELPYLLTLQRLGYVSGHLKDIDEQSSVLKFKWTNQEVIANIPEVQKALEHKKAS